MTWVSQTFQTSDIEDVNTAVHSAISALSINTRPGDSVALTAGSRGIDRIDEVIKSCIQYLANIGLKPFIVTGMGSHGGATSGGQRRVIENLGITESAMGVPIRAEMEVASIGQLPCGMHVLLSASAINADHIVVINRIKPHTKFTADVESGLCKMMAVGLGNRDGAAAFHRSAVSHSFDILEQAAELILDRCRILFGIALLEDAHGRLAHIEAIAPESIIDREKALLKTAYAHMGRIPFEALDVLIVDGIGKQISGIGMDSNVTGRHRDITGNFNMRPKIGRIFVRDLAPGADGNANGIGLADVTTKRLVEAMDMQKTYTNALNAISPEKAAIPMYFESDLDALDACIRTSGVETPQQARVVRIKDTAHLSILQVSKTLEAEIEANPHLKRISPWQPLEFDQKGNISQHIPAA